MTQQQPNLRRSMRIVRRHKGIVGGFVLLGLVAGVGYAVLNPPQQTSSALVILPTPKPNIQTDTLIAESAPVLTAALPKIGHGMTLTALHQGITATDATGNVISVNATDKTAAEAEDDANAVAASFLSFIGPPTARSVR